jgi:hypothetical protein
VRIEPFPMTPWVRGTESAQITAPSPQPVVAGALGGSPATPAGGVEGDLALFATLDDLKAANARTFDSRYAAQQKDAHDQALLLHRDYAMRGPVADLKAFAADIVPKIEMHVQMAAELQSDHRTG